MAGDCLRKPVLDPKYCQDRLGGYSIIIIPDVVLPGVPLVVVLEDLVQLPGPVDGVDHLGLAVEHVGGDVDRGEAGVDGDAGEVLVGGEDHPGVADPVELVVLVSVLGEVADIVLLLHRI